jgi:hypothetical protein
VRPAVRSADYRARVAPTGYKPCAFFGPMIRSISFAT